MKHIRSYKLFESHLHIDQVNDILQDLVDEGFNVDANLHSFRTYYKIDVYINRVNMIDDMDNEESASRFTYSEIKNSVDHLLSFLEQNGYKLESSHALLNYRPMPFDMDLASGDNVMGRFELRFVKYKDECAKHIRKATNRKLFEFTNHDEKRKYIRQHLYDICLELKDIGFNYAIIRDGADICQQSTFDVIVEIWKFSYQDEGDNIFQISDVIDVIDHINSYMISEGFKTIVYINDKDCPNMGYTGKIISQSKGFFDYNSIQKKDIADLYITDIHLNFAPKDEKKLIFGRVY